MWNYAINVSVLENQDVTVPTVPCRSGCVHDGLALNSAEDRSDILHYDPSYTVVLL